MNSPCTQVETIGKIKESVALTNNDIKYMKQEISEIKANQVVTNEKLDNLLDRLDSKFAAKRTEWVIKGMIALILVGVFSAILAQVIVK